MLATVDEGDPGEQELCLLKNIPVELLDEGADVCIRPQSDNGQFPATHNRQCFGASVQINGHEPNLLWG